MVDGGASSLSRLGDDGVSDADEVVAAAAATFTNL
jgi:hypothetical protein